MTGDLLGSLILLLVLICMLVVVGLDEETTSDRTRSVRIAWAAVTVCAVCLACVLAGWLIEATRSG